MNQEINLTKAQTEATLSHMPSRKQLLMFRNGMLQSPTGDYAINGQVISLIRPADAEEYLTVLYRKRGLIERLTARG